MNKKVFLLLFFGLCVSFIIFSCFGVYMRSTMRAELINLSNEFGKESSEYIWSQSRENAMKAVERLTVARASQINFEMEQLEADVELLANTMTRILSNSNNYKPRDFKSLTVNKGSGEPFILFSEEIFNSRTSNMNREIANAANIQDLLSDIRVSYAPNENASYIASKDGYFICVKTDPVGDDINAPFDARERPWYKDAQRAMKTTFSNIFIDEVGKKSVTCVTPYYKDNEFAGVAGIGCNIDSWYDILVKNAVREGRECFVLNEAGDVIISSSDKYFLALTQNSNEQMATIAKKMTSGMIGVEEVNLDGDTFYISYAPLKTTGWSLAFITSNSNVIKYADNIKQNFDEKFFGFIKKSGENYSRLSIIGGIFLMIILLSLAAASRVLTKKFVKPINDLTEGVKEISAGNLDKKLNVKTGDELQVLAENFNTMTDELKSQMRSLEKVTAEKERIATELDVATKIQKSMLPKKFDVDKRVDIFAVMTPAKEVGGDLYDFYKTDENFLTITIADVSGKGVPAALFMVATITNLRNFTSSLKNPGDLKSAMENTNDRLCANNDGGLFVTMFSGTLNLSTGKFYYVNAGHNPTLIKRRGKRFEELSMELNFVLGGWENWNYIQQEIQIEEGDAIFLYTDGVTEAVDLNGKMYSLERLKNFLNELPEDLSAQEILNAVKKSVQEFSNGAEQADDITMLALVYERCKINGE